MPSRKQPPRLYLRRRRENGRQNCWIIRDGSQFISTGCGQSDLEGAQEALEKYLTSKHKPTTSTAAEKILIADVLDVYMKEHVGELNRPDNELAAIGRLLNWWSGRSVSEIKGRTCRDYTNERGAKASARRELETLRAAINFYHGEYGLNPLPVVTLPEKSQARTRWLTRSEAAALIWSAWRNPRGKHLARFLLIGLYTGTRSQAILRLRWTLNESAGWIDLDNGLLFRRGGSERETKKRRPPARIHARLLPHLRRWRRLDQDDGIDHVIHWRGKAVRKLRRSPESARREAGLDDDVVMHTLRHTAATWQMQAGTPIWEAAGYLGMSVETLKRVYGHFHPDFQKKASTASAPKQKRSPRKNLAPKEEAVPQSVPH